MSNLVSEKRAEHLAKLEVANVILAAALCAYLADQNKDTLIDLKAAERALEETIAEAEEWI